MTGLHCQAKRIADEGSRFNLNPLRGGGVTPTLNQPFIALMFLQRENKDRSTFRLDRRHTAYPTVVIEFTERAKRRLIATPDDAAAQGLFWIEAETGTCPREQADGVHGTSASRV